MEGLGAKTTLDMNDASRRKLGLQPAISELLYVRAQWATFHERGAAESPRCRPRRSSQPRSPGYRSRAAASDSCAPRSKWKGRDIGALWQSACARNIRCESRHAWKAPPAKRCPAGKAEVFEDIRREARESWLRLRKSQGLGHAEPAPPAAADRVHDDDFTR